MHLRVVDLPHPLGPKSARASPDSMLKLTLSIALTPPKLFIRLVTITSKDRCYGNSYLPLIKASRPMNLITIIVMMSRINVWNVIIAAAYSI